MRFALLETKIALIELLKRYTFVRAPDTQVNIKIIISSNIGIYVYVYVCPGSPTDSA